MKKIKENHILMVVFLSFLLKVTIISPNFQDVCILAILALSYGYSLYLKASFVNRSDENLRKELESFSDLKEKVELLNNSVSSIKVAQGFKPNDQQKRYL